MFTPRKQFVRVKCERINVYISAKWTKSRIQYTRKFTLCERRQPDRATVFKFYIFLYFTSCLRKTLYLPTSLGGNVGCICPVCIYCNSIQRNIFCIHYFIFEQRNPNPLNMAAVFCHNSTLTARLEPICTIAAPVGTIPYFIN